MTTNTLESSGASYILTFDEFKSVDLSRAAVLLTPDVLQRARQVADDNVEEIFKGHPKENRIKLICLHYFLTVYLLVASGVTDKSSGVKPRLRKLVAEHNGEGDLLQSLQNFDFCMGSCGIEAQNLALAHSQM